MAARLRRLTPGLGLAGLLALVGTACVQNDGTRWNPVKAVTGGDVTAQKEREIGFEFDRQVRAQLRHISDPVVVGFVNDLGQEIVRQIEPQPFVYRFRVIEDPRINAFAVPGGYIYLHSGTLLKASSLQELAGVMGHEIAHVKQRHYARARAKNAIPSLLTQLAAVGATVASGNAAPILVAQGVNVAMQLKNSREFEDEADAYGGVYMSRAGFDPEGMADFFDTLLQEDRPDAINIPPYLYSHPDVEDRLETARLRAQDLRPMKPVDPALVAEFEQAQARLAWLVDHDETEIITRGTAEDPTWVTAALAEVDAYVRAERFEAARAKLDAAEAREPNDPRIPFRRGELLESLGDDAGAVAAYRRAAELDPTTALVHYRLGTLYREAGDRHRATYYLEEASRRATPGTTLYDRADRAVVALTFPVLEDAGLADGFDGGEPGGVRTSFRPGDREIVWWGRVGSRYIGQRERIVVRWLGPLGIVRQETTAEAERRPYAASRLRADPASPWATGRWSVEAMLEGNVVDQREFEVRP